MHESSRVWFMVNRTPHTFYRARRRRRRALRHLDGFLKPGMAWMRTTRMTIRNRHRNVPCVYSHIPGLRFRKKYDFMIILLSCDGVRAIPPRGPIRRTPQVSAAVFIRDIPNILRSSFPCLINLLERFFSFSFVRCPIELRRRVPANTPRVNTLRHGFFVKSKNSIVGMSNRQNYRLAIIVVSNIVAQSDEETAWTCVVYSSVLGNDYDIVIVVVTRPGK